MLLSITYHNKLRDSKGADLLSHQFFQTLGHFLFTVSHTILQDHKGIDT